jgi:hypothetical protein
MKKLIFIISILTNSSLYINAQKTNESSSKFNDSLLTRLRQGSYDLSIITDLHERNTTLSEDSLKKLVLISNQNYCNKVKAEDIMLDIKLREIYLSDQIYRNKCYYHKTIKYNVVQRNDSSLQIKFSNLIPDHTKINMFQNQIYQMTFDLLLIHSVSTLHTNFFKNNFHKYSNAFSNNFSEFGDLKGLIDIYLKFKYNKQYFETEWGKGRLDNKSFGFLPRMTKEELDSILTDLKIIDPKY